LDHARQGGSTEAVAVALLEAELHGARYFAQPLYIRNCLISMGFVSTPELVSMLRDTLAISTLDLNQYDAIMVAGGQAPMFSYREDSRLHNAIRAFYEAEKPVAVHCHGVAALVDLKLSDGSYLVEGKRSRALVTSRRLSVIRRRACRSCHGGSSRN
jgi:hypothetical protein